MYFWVSAGRGIDQVLALPGLGGGRAVRLEHENAGVLLDDGFVALAVRRDPDSRGQAEGLDVGGEARHAVREGLVDTGPVARAMAPFLGLGLPAVVDLDVFGAVVLQVFGDPFGVALDLGLVDVLVVVIPGAPARRRQRENRSCRSACSTSPGACRDSSAASPCRP